MVRLASSAILKIEESLTMKRIFSAALLLPAVLVVCFGQAAQRETTHVGSDERGVRQFIDDFAAAFSRNDAAALDSLTAPGYTFVTPAGGIQDKAQRLAPMKSGDLKYDSVSYEDVGMRVYGNMAVVTSRVVVKGRNKGADISGQFRSTLTLFKMKGRWQLVASQATAVKP
jgi:ketosteroid isomerase-like protein